MGLLFVSAGQAEGFQNFNPIGYHHAPTHYRLSLVILDQVEPVAGGVRQLFGGGLPIEMGLPKSEDVYRQAVGTERAGDPAPANRAQALSLWARYFLS